MKADNRVLSKNAKYSYLNTNYNSGVSSIVVANSVGFAADDYILLGEFGSETTEVVQINTVTASTHTFSLKSATKFSHSESTKVSILRYNQVRFYHTTTTTVNTTDPVTGYIDIQADSTHTRAYDTTNITGYGWFFFYNSTTTAATQWSNAIPYAGFAENSVKNIFDTFFGLLNSKEKKLVSNTDAFRYLNEAYAIAQNELNLTNTSYTVDDSEDVTTDGTTQEYELPSNFSQIVSVYDDTNNVNVNKIDLEKLYLHDEVSGNTVKYYIRGNYIGFSPIPSDVRIYKVRYRTKTTALNSYYDNVDLPNNNFYSLVDFMLYRASPKLNRDGSTFYSAFVDGIKRLKVTSFKQDNNKDSWGISDSSNV